MSTTLEGLDLLEDFTVDDPRYPFYHLIPKDPAELVEFRRKVIAAGYQSEENAELLRQMCEADLLFFVNTFCWVFDPKQLEPLIFNTYPYQDHCLQTMNAALWDVLEKRKLSADVGIEKSRDLGATWMLLVMFFHWWLFRPRACFGLVSKDEVSVDRTNDEGTLFWKLEFLVDHIPGWMRPNFSRTHMKLYNHDSLAAIFGYTATGNVARGGRKLAFAKDELAAFEAGDDEAAMASTQYVTDVRFLISTFQGQVGVFYDCMRGRSSNITKIVLDWKQHPTRVKGLYTSKGSVLEYLRNDKSEYSDDYPYILDGKVRSPYYDEQCKRPGATPAKIAEELDRDPVGSGVPYFSSILLKRLQEHSAVQPFVRGELDYDPDTLEPTFIANPEGRLKLWIPIVGPNFVPSPMLRAAVGNDISAGTAGAWTSNSVSIAFDVITGRQIAEFATNSMRPDLFADWNHAFCTWLNGAYLNWEVNGPGGESFGKQIMDNGYRNIFYNEVTSVIYKKKTQEPGFRASIKSKPRLLSSWLSAVDRDDCQIFSADLIDECGQYVHRDNQIVHLGSIKTSDHSSKKASHGDRVIAAAVAWLARGDRKPERDEKKDEYQNWTDIPTDELPIGCAAERILEWDRRHEVSSGAIF